MLLVVFYLIVLLNLLLCWKCITDEVGAWRYVWAIVAAVTLTLPLWLPLKVAFYYGLVTTVSLFFWSSDTYMDLDSSRLRGVLGGVLLLPIPFIIPSVTGSWSQCLLVPTIGHAVSSAIAWLIVVGFLRRLVEGHPPS